MDCRRIESLLPPYVDGEAPASEVALIESHLAGCPACRFAVSAQRTSKVVLGARGRQIASLAPPGFARARGRPYAVSPRISLGWRGRATAFASAAALVIIGIAGFELITPHSNVLYAAQLAIDHVRCFVVEMSSTEKVEPAALERGYAERYGWHLKVPRPNDDSGLRLVAARRCPFWPGRHAHVLYRTGRQEVSLYVDQTNERGAGSGTCWATPRPSGNGGAPRMS